MIDLPAFDWRFVAGVCVGVSVLLLILVLRRGATTYEHAFVARVSAGLRQNFVVADPRDLADHDAGAAFAFGRAHSVSPVSGSSRRATNFVT